MKIKPLIKKENKEGMIRLIIFFSLLMGILVIGFVATMVWSITDIASDTITPIMTDLGMVGSTNLSQVSEYTFGTLSGFLNSLNWIIAIGFVFALIMTLVFIFIAGYNPHPAFIGIFMVFMVFLIFLCVLISNIYQDIYTGNDDLSSRLHEQTIMSYLILNSPFIMSMIAVIGGILIFTRQQSAEGGIGI